MPLQSSTAENQNSYPPKKVMEKYEINVHSLHDKPSVKGKQNFLI